MNSGPLYRVVRFSLRFRGVVSVVAALFVAYGLYAFRSAKYDVFPEFAPPLVSVQTEAPGLAPEQVEVLVTQPIENAINGVAGIASLRSSSVQGLSVINVGFKTGIDLYRIRQAVTERLATLAGQLPHGVNAPAMSPLTSSTGDLMTVGLTSNTLDLTQLRTLADWTIKQRLLRVPGVAKVAVFGGGVRELQVQVRPQQLIRYGLTIDDVLAAARGATGIRGAGFVDTPNQRIVLTTEGQSVDAAALARTPLVKTGAAGVEYNLRLSDVADVREDVAPRISAAAVMGTPGVVLNISSQYGANTLEVTRHIDTALAELGAPLAAQHVTLYPDLFRAAAFVKVATHNVYVALAFGAALVVAVLLLFLFDLRAAAISCAVIPLSLLAGATILDRLGYTLNTMTLGGFAIAIGLLVDDAVITVENVFRRLRENRHAHQPRPPLQVILGATLEVRAAVVYATLVVALVFVPVLTLPGLAGRLFAPLGIAYVLATLGSLFTALTVTPALCALWLPRAALSEREPPVVRFVKTHYLKILLRVETHVGAIVGGIVFLTVAAGILLPFIGGSFLPELKEGHFIVHMSAMPGTSLDQSLRLGGFVTRALRDDPEVRTVAQRVGRASADDIFGPQSSEFEVDLKPLDAKQAEGAQTRVRDLLTRFVGASFSVNTFLTERIQETISGYTAAVALNLFGNDLDALDRNAQEIARILRQTPGAADVQVQSPPGTPQLAIRLRPEALARQGLDAVKVMDTVRTAYQGAIVGQIYRGTQVFNLAVILAPAARRGLADVARLPVATPSGTAVRLGDIAEVRQVAGRYAVLHEGAQRVQTITANVSGRNIGAFVAEARARIAQQVKLPAGSYVQFSGAAQAQHDAQRSLFINGALIAIAIGVFLRMTVKSGRNLALMLANLPFALVGGVLAAALAGGGISIGALVGFVTLFGISLRNAMMMIAHYEHLVHVEGAVWNRDTARRGALERVTPILMTALVTALGLLPLALGANAPGREIEGPMAIVILGGLLTSTLLNLVVLPALVLRYGRFDSTADSDGLSE